jgi:hypothetical protein
MTANPTPAPLFVFSRDGTLQGTTKGHGFRCRLDGCTGLRLTVRWPDGKTTKPCTKGMHEREDGHWQIG